VNLTSLRRVKYALGLNKTDQDHILSRLVGAASRQIAHYLKRMGQDGLDGLQLKSRTEYIDPIDGQRSFYPKAYPIQSITSIYTDGFGQYAGDETVVDSDDYLVGSDGRTIHFIRSPSHPDYLGNSFPVVARGVRLIYTAGLAADPVVSSWTKSADVGGSLTVGNYVQGVDSLSVGRITAAAAGTISFECLSSPFLPLETIREYSTWNFALQESGPGAPTEVSATLTACTSPSLAEAEPALVEACEMHIQFLRANRDSLQNVTVTNDGATKTSRQDLNTRYGFAPEIKDILDPYMNRLVQ
jgi:hypothetical protein